MNYIDILIFILSIGTTGVGWFAKTIYKELNDTKKDLNDLKFDIGKNYVNYERLKDIMGPVMSALNDIKETLKTKADK